MRPGQLLPLGFAPGLAGCLMNHLWDTDLPGNARYVDGIIMYHGNQFSLTIHQGMAGQIDRATVLVKHPGYREPYWPLSFVYILLVNNMNNRYESLTID